MCFLAIDIGNTRLKWALYDAPRRGAELLAHGAEFLENIERLAEGPWRELPAPKHMLGSVVAGEAIRRRIEVQLMPWKIHPRWLEAHASEGGLGNGYEHPAQLGADRWAAMIGARHHMLAHGRHAPLIVVMVGTAMTVDAIDAQGNFLGGIILPGHGAMLRALEYETAGLHVPSGAVCMFPTNTSDALTSGSTYALVGAIERMYHHLETHGATKPHCIMAGGAAWKVAPFMLHPYDLVEGLIFDGLLAIAESRLAVGVL